MIQEFEVDVVRIEQRNNKLQLSVQFKHLEIEIPDGGHDRSYDISISIGIGMFINTDELGVWRKRPLGREIVFESATIADAEYQLLQTDTVFQIDVFQDIRLKRVQRMTFTLSLLSTFAVDHGQKLASKTFEYRFESGELSGGEEEQ